MSAYKIKLLKKETVAKETMAFHFEKPYDFAYRAGQYGYFSLINPQETDSEGSKRNFSLASAPHEGELMVVTRMRNTAFKRTLRDLPEGSEIELEGPFGSFALPKTQSTPAVFLAGGIGSTLVRSMVAQATYEQLQQKIILFHSNHSPEDSVFMDEFKTLAEQNRNFYFIPTMTDLEDQQWTGEKGHITMELLKKNIEDINIPIYYLSGSTAMVTAMRTMLANAGVNKYNIRFEQYVGY